MYYFRKIDLNIPIANKTNANPYKSTNIGIRGIVHPATAQTAGDILVIEGKPDSKKVRYG